MTNSFFLSKPIIRIIALILVFSILLNYMYDVKVYAEAIAVSYGFVMFLALLTALGITVTSMQHGRTLYEDFKLWAPAESLSNFLQSAKANFKQMIRTGKVKFTEGMNIVKEWVKARFGSKINDGTFDGSDNISYTKDKVYHYDNMDFNVLSGSVTYIYNESNLGYKSETLSFRQNGIGLDAYLVHSSMYAPYRNEWVITFSDGYVSSTPCWQYIKTGEGVEGFLNVEFLGYETVKQNGKYYKAYRIKASSKTGSTTRLIKLEEITETGEFIKNVYDPVEPDIEYIDVPAYVWGGTSSNVLNELYNPDIYIPTIGLLWSLAEAGLLGETLTSKLTKEVSEEGVTSIVYNGTMDELIEDIENDPVALEYVLEGILTGDPSSVLDIPAPPIVVEREDGLVFEGVEEQEIPDTGDETGSTGILRILDTILNVLKAIRDFLSDFIRNLLNRISGILTDIKDTLVDLKDSLLYVPDNISIDFSPIKDIPIAEKFPFSLPWDVKRAFNMLKAEPKAPKWEIKIKNASYVIDFAQFEQLAFISRSFTTVIFVLCLIILTRRFISGS